MNKPELLMPAGNIEKLKYAVTYGADAVYLGVVDFSLRAMRKGELITIADSSSSCPSLNAFSYLLSWYFTIKFEISDEIIIVKIILILKISFRYLKYLLIEKILNFFFGYGNLIII